MIALSRHKWDAQLSNSLTHEVKAFGHASAAYGTWYESITTEQNITTKLVILTITFARSQIWLFNIYFSAIIPFD